MRKMTIVALAAALALVLSGCELITSAKSDDSSNSSSSKAKVTGKVTLTVYNGYTLPSDAKVLVRLVSGSSYPYSTTLDVTATSGTINYNYSISGVADGTYAADATVVAHDGSSLGSAAGGTASSFSVSGGSGTVADMSVTYGSSFGKE